MIGPFEEEIVTNHFVETASINRRFRKVTRYHDHGMQGTPVPCDNAASAIAPPAFPRRRGLGIRLIGRNETMRRIEGEEIAGHIGRDPLVGTSGAHLAGEMGLVRDFT